MLTAALLCSCSQVKENKVQENAENEATEQDSLYEKLSEYQLETQEDAEKYFRDFGDFTVKYKAVATASRGLDKNGEWEYAEWEPCEFDIILNCDLAAICAFSEEIKIFYLNDYWADEDSRDMASFTQFHLSGLDEQDREIEVLLQPAEGKIDEYMSGTEPFIITFDETTEDIEAIACTRCERLYDIKHASIDTPL